MTEAQNKAWQILTDEEKTALTLSLVNGKSTWESGEIMDKAHYKYLEIRQRAEKFLKLFTEYFQTYESVIPKGSILDKHFKKYITLTIHKRLNLKQTIDQLNCDLYKRPKTREIEILRELQSLNGSKFHQDQNLFHLIKDFDRWNNFRILPVSIQEPSAFKRRNKHRLRKLVNLFTSLNPIAVLKIKQLYQVKRVDLTKDYFYLPLLTTHDKKLTEVIRVPNNQVNLKSMDNLILYVFKEEQDAKRFIEIIESYIEKDYKHCKDGQVFWPEFRIITQRALNYNEIQKITPSRKHVLDNAGKDSDVQWFLSSKRKQS